MPQNEVEQVEVITSKISAGLMRVTRAMNELQIEDPEAEIAKILEEQADYDKRLNLDQVKNNGNQ